MVTDQAEALLIVAPAWIVFATDIDEFDDVTVAFVGAVVKAEALDVTMAAATAVISTFSKSGNIVALRNRSEGVRDVVEFVSDCVSDSSQADDHGENADRHDENQFSRDDETGFVVKKCIECVSHLEFPLLNASVREKSQKSSK